MPDPTADPSGGVLEIAIRCHTDPDHKRPRTHPIFIHPDWTVDTGHDLEAERFAVAFGGYLSCLALPDAVLPAVRAYLSRQVRLELPELSLSQGGRWHAVQRVERCCAASRSFTTAQEAAAHLRTPKHLAMQYGALPAAVASLGKSVLAARGLTDPVPPPAAATSLVGRAVATMREVHLLWDAGLTPELIQSVHDVATDGRLMPPSFYFGVLSGRPDLRWVREAALEVAPAEVKAWLPWTPSVDEPPTEWFRLGVSGRHVAALAASPYRPTDVTELSDALRVTNNSAAATLAAWADAGCFPSVAELVEVCRRADAGPSSVSKASVDRLVELLSPSTGSRKELAFALTLCGSPPIAAYVISIVGSVEPDDLARGLRDWEHHRQQPARQGGRALSA